MKDKVSLPVVIAAVLAVIGIAAFVWIRFTASPQGSAATGPPPVPPNVTAELQKYQPIPGRTSPGNAGGPPTPMVGGGMPGMSVGMPAPGMSSGMTPPGQGR